MKYAWLAGGAFSLLPIGLVVACATSADASKDGDVGTIEAAISAVGPDGATYSLPSGSYIVASQGGVIATCRPVVTTSPTQIITPPYGRRLPGFSFDGLRASNPGRRWNS